MHFEGQFIPEDSTMSRRDGGAEKMWRHKDATPKSNRNDLPCYFEDCKIVMHVCRRRCPISCRDVLIETLKMPTSMPDTTNGLLLTANVVEMQYIRDLLIHWQVQLYGRFVHLTRHRNIEKLNRKVTITQDLFVDKNVTFWLAVPRMVLETSCM